jgi:hypothetical protein
VKADLVAVRLVLATVQDETWPPTAAGSRDGQLDGAKAHGAQSPDGGRRAVAEEGVGPEAELRRQKVGPVDDPPVTDGVDVVEEPVKPALVQATCHLCAGKSQPLKLRPGNDAELATRHTGHGHFAARVFCITMRRFALAHGRNPGDAPPGGEGLWQKIYA